MTTHELGEELKTATGDRLAELQAERDERRIVRALHSAKGAAREQLLAELAKIRPTLAAEWRAQDAVDAREATAVASALLAKPEHHGAIVPASA
jgi:hypothetical protein